MSTQEEVPQTNEVAQSQELESEISTTDQPKLSGDQREAKLEKKVFVMNCESCKNDPESMKMMAKHNENMLKKMRKGEKVDMNEWYSYE